MNTRALSTTAFVTLLAIAAMMGANHVAARVAFNDGTAVATAVVLRSAVTAAVLGLLLWRQRPAHWPVARQWRMMVGVGLLMGLQSLCLYAAVARLPVALALLAFNTFPIFAAVWAWAVYGQRPSRQLLWAMPLLITGLGLALDVMGAASGLGARGQWQHIGAGLGFSLAAAATFGLLLVLTQQEVAGVDARLRTAVALALACAVALGASATQSSWQLPQSASGWTGLVLLTVLYGTGITLLLAVLPRWGVVGNSPILNIEPVVALVLAWAVLGQRISALQLVGAALVVGVVMALGLRRR